MQGVGKLAISDQYLAIARKRLKIDGYMLLCVWTTLNPLFIHATFTAIIPGAYPGEAKMCLSWLQKLTHVPLAIAILIVIFLRISVCYCFMLIELLLVGALPSLVSGRHFVFFLLLFLTLFCFCVDKNKFIHYATQAEKQTERQTQYNTDWS